MAESNLNILINAKNNTAGALNQVQGQLGGLNKAAGLAAGGMAALGVAAGIAGVVKLGQATFAMAESAAQGERLATAYENLATAAGQSSDKMLIAMRAASRGTIADTDLMMAANRASLLGVATTATELTQLIEVASARGKALGLSTAVAFDNIVTGIGRMSPLILDNLGIVLKGGEKVFDLLAASTGRTADELTDVEKKQYLIKAAFESTQGLIESNSAAGADLADKFEKMDASIKNAKQALGEMFGPAVAEIASQLADAVTKVTDKMIETRDLAPLEDNLNSAQIAASEFNTKLYDLNAVLIQLRNESIALGEVMLWNSSTIFPAAIDNNRDAMIAWVEQEIAATEAAGKFQFATVAAAQALLEMQGATDSTIVAINHYTAMMAPAIAETARLQAAIEGFTTSVASKAGPAIAQARSIALGLVDSLGPMGALGEFQSMTDEVTGLVRVMEDMNYTDDQMDFSIAGMTSRWKENLTTVKDVSTAVGTMATAVDTLTPKIASLLSAQLDPGVGVDPSQFLPREDAINEDARRLADVAVNGYASPWYEYLNSKFPDLFQAAMEGSGGNVSQAAAGMLRDFQNGLRPELLDKDAAKERIKQMLVGDANMAALAAEISAELNAEMGGQFSAADINKATGTALGTDKAMSTGLEGTGKAAVTTVTKEIDGAVDLIKSSGEGAGRNWGTGFLATVGEAIPARLIEILATVVTPGVWARIITNQGQTVPDGAS